MIGSLLSRQKLTRPMSAPSENPLGYYGGLPVAWEAEPRAEYVKAYVNRVWVNRCVRLIVNSTVGTPLVARNRGEVVEDHRVHALLDRPSPRDPAATLVGEATHWAHVVGDWYFELLPNMAGEPAQALPMRAHLVRVVPGQNGMPKSYVYDKDENGNPVTIEAVELGRSLQPNTAISGRLGNPLDDWYGMPPLRAAKDDIISEYYGVRYDHKFFHNGARPDTVVGFKGELSDQQRKKNREAWQSFKGVDNAHKAVVMDGDPNVQTLTQNPKDVEYHDGRLLAREGQCAAFGVPPVLVGDMQKATYSNFKEAEPIFWKETMLPWLDFLGKWLTATIVPFYDDIDELVFDVASIQALQESENDKIDRLRNGVSGAILTPNEARTALDLPELEDEAADRLHLAQTVVPITGTDEKQPAPGEPQPTAPAKRKEKLDIGDLPADAQRAVTQRHLEMEQAVAMVTEEVARVFDAQYLSIATIVGGKAKMSDIEKAIDEYDWNGDQSKLTAIVEAMHAAMVNRAVIHGQDYFGLDAGDLSQGDSSKVQAMLRQLINRPDGITTVTGRVKDEIIEEVRKGIELGIPQRGIATGGTFDVGPPGDRAAQQVTIQGIKGRYEGYKTWEADRIARTEATVSYNSASAAVMREAGIQFVDILDGDNDADCADANGARWPLSQFEMFPIAHPNCVRMGLPVMPEDVRSEDLLLLARGGIVRKGEGPMLNGPESLVPPTHVHLEPKAAPTPTIHIHQPAGDPPTVNVSPAEVHVDIPEHKGSAPRVIELERDEHGFVTRMVEQQPAPGDG